MKSLSKHNDEAAVRTSDRPYNLFLVSQLVPPVYISIRDLNRRLPWNYRYMGFRDMFVQAIFPHDVSLNSRR